MQTHVHNSTLIIGSAQIPFEWFPYWMIDYYAHNN